MITVCEQKRKHTPEYSAWSHIVQRCTNSKCKEWPNYGGRGISICQEWRDSYQAFLDHVGPRPSPRHTIDRYPNNDGDYEPGNVRWATMKEQARNTRRTRLVIFKGQTKCLQDWANEFGVSYQCLQARLKRGFPLDQDRRESAKTHCESGHAFTPDNTYLTKRGHRRCVSCTLQSNRASHRRSDVTANVSEL
jgi:hypothetical protein